MDPPPPYTAYDTSTTTMVRTSTTQATSVLAELKFPWRIVFARTSANATGTVSMKRKDIIIKLLQMEEESMEIRYTIDNNHQRNNVDNSSHSMTMTATEGRNTAGDQAVEWGYRALFFIIFSMALFLQFMMVVAITNIVRVGAWKDLLPCAGLLVFTFTFSMVMAVEAGMTIFSPVADPILRALENLLKSLGF